VIHGHRISGVSSPIRYFAYHYSPSGRIALVRALRQRDLRLLAQLLDSLDQVPADAFAARVAVGLHTIVPGAVSSYNEFGPRSAAVAAVEPWDAQGSAEIRAAFERLAWQHPVLARFRAARSQPARSISDYASRRELERLDLYHAVYRPLGITDQISIAIPGPGQLTIGIAMGRERRGFSQRERLLLELLRPHLAAGRLREGREAALRDARAALEAASGAQERAVVVLTPGGRIAWATSPARRLLREWFAHNSGAILPEQLASWIATTRSSAGQGAPAPAAGPLRLARGQRTLTVTRLGPSEPDGELLLALEQHAVPAAEHLTRLRLTRREGEVLAAAARGLGEQGIAGELMISRRTVNKHLEHAYRKLNVSDRTQAIAAACEEPS
jgi:DNA-binding CsgD family transcriptional regulator